MTRKQLAQVIRYMRKGASLDGAIQAARRTDYRPDSEVWSQARLRLTTQAFYRPLRADFETGMERTLKLQRAAMRRNVQ